MPSFSAKRRWTIKQGKEASVFLVEGPQGLLAAKVYADMKVRTFRNDRIYREARFIPDARIKKAIDQRSITGLDAHHALWIASEYGYMYKFHRAGIKVPKPLAHAGRVILMEYFGDKEQAAARLSDEYLSEEQAASAFAQSVAILKRMYQMGKIHSDFSTFNLLWWQDQVIAIDFPQVVEATENPMALTLLRHDCETLCKSFRRFHIEYDPQVLYEEVLASSAISYEGYHVPEMPPSEVTI